MSTTTITAEAAEPVGLVEVAERFGTTRGVVDVWRFRKALPDPRWTVGGRPAWHWPDLLAWADATGRSVPLSKPEAVVPVDVAPDDPLVPPAETHPYAVTKRNLVRVVLASNGTLKALAYRTRTGAEKAAERHGGAVTERKT